MYFTDFTLNQFYEAHRNSIELRAPEDVVEAPLGDFPRLLPYSFPIVNCHRSRNYDSRNVKLYRSSWDLNPSNIQPANSLPSKRERPGYASYLRLHYPYSARLESSDLRTVLLASTLSFPKSSPSTSASSSFQTDRTSQLLSRLQAYMENETAESDSYFHRVLVLCDGYVGTSKGPFSSSLTPPSLTPPSLIPSSSAPSPALRSMESVEPDVGMWLEDMDAFAADVAARHLSEELAMDGAMLFTAMMDSFHWFPSCSRFSLFQSSSSSSSPSSSFSSSANQTSSTPLHDPLPPSPLPLPLSSLPVAAQSVLWRRVREMNLAGQVVFVSRSSLVVLIQLTTPALAFDTLSGVKQEGGYAQDEKMVVVAEARFIMALRDLKRKQPITAPPLALTSVAENKLFERAARMQAQRQATRATATMRKGRDLLRSEQKEKANKKGKEEGEKGQGEKEQGDDEEEDRKNIAKSIPRSQQLLMHQVLRFHGRQLAGEGEGRGLGFERGERRFAMSVPPSPPSPSVPTRFGPGNPNSTFAALFDESDGRTTRYIAAAIPSSPIVVSPSSVSPLPTAPSPTAPSPTAPSPTLSLPPLPSSPLAISATEVHRVIPAHFQDRNTSHTIFGGQQLHAAYEHAQSVAIQHAAATLAVPIGAVAGAVRERESAVVLQKLKTAMSSAAVEEAAEGCERGRKGRRTGGRRETGGNGGEKMANAKSQVYRAEKIIAINPTSALSPSPSSPSSPSSSHFSNTNPNNASRSNEAYSFVSKRPHRAAVAQQGPVAHLLGLVRVLWIRDVSFLAPILLGDLMVLSGRVTFADREGLIIVKVLVQKRQLSSASEGGSTTPILCSTMTAAFRVADVYRRLADQFFFRGSRGGNSTSSLPSSFPYTVPYRGRTIHPSGPFVSVVPDTAGEIEDFLDAARLVMHEEGDGGQEDSKQKQVSKL